MCVGFESFGFALARSFPWPNFFFPVVSVTDEQRVYKCMNDDGFMNNA